MQNSMDAIVEQVLKGNTDQYAEIIYCYQKDVAKVITAMLFNRQESEDLIQQVFISAYENLDRYKPGSDMKLWLKGIARNVVKVHLRNQRTSHKHLALYRKWLEDINNQTDCYHAWLEERNSALKVCYDALPKHSRTLICMRYHDSMNIGSISKTIGKSVVAITKSLSRIREMLKDCIKAKVTQ